MRGVAVALLVAAMAAAVAGGHHIVRLLVLAAAGLASLYMVHLLAQDWNHYNKITRRPAAKLLFKRHTHLPSSVRQPSRRMEDLFLAAMKTKLRRAEELDTRGCAKRLVCQLAATPPRHRRPYQDDLLDMIWKSNRRSQQEDSFQFAVDLGHQTRNQSVCFDLFNQCPFQTASLLSIIEIPSAAYTNNIMIN